MIYFALPILLLLSLITPSFSKDIYKWVDQDGHLHFTDNPILIPEGKLEKAEIIEGQKKELGREGNLEPDLLEEQKKKEELALREFWRGLALEIENKEKAILREINNVEKQIDYKKREVDYLLTNGYFADRSILELRYLEDYLGELRSQLIVVAQERENLGDEARRQGIPPGYLRR